MYGDLTKNPREKCSPIITEYKKLSDTLWEEKTYIVIPETIGQYIGLEDKNGKKIFEKDWLYDEPNDWHYTVGFEDGVFCLLLDEEVVWDDVYEYKNQCEVISTIFDRNLIRK